ncbi:hypothetical protein HMPREF3092_05780 [Brevibacterium sp. HMSC24B04]|nr:hypothetical protein HMPREF3092_05780 [Brevibacterium sp. HMSC24B04]
MGFLYAVLMPGTRLRLAKLVVEEHWTYSAAAKRCSWSRDGNNIRAAHFTEAQKHTDRLMIPVAVPHDSENRALYMMAAFSATGHDHLVANAVVLVHETELIERDDEGYPISNQSHELTSVEIATAFESRVRADLPVPYDPKLKDGGAIDYFQLFPRYDHRRPWSRNSAQRCTY